MKNQLSKKLMPLALGGLIFAVSCQKETSESISNELASDPQTGIKVSGAVVDDSATLANVPVLVSAEFHNSGTVLGASRKKTSGSGTTSGGTTSGGTTSGGTTSGGTTVLPPPPTTLPTSYSLQMPPVQYQGGEFACVPFAVGYAVRSAEQYYKTGATSYSYSTNVFSPEFLYNQTKIGDCGSGTSVVRALEFMKSTGICTWQSMPYSATNGCTLLPTSTQLSQAASYKISSYSGIYTTDVTAIKTMLVNKHPLIITVTLDQSFTNAQPGFIWKSFSGSGGFSHALTICGYDDARQAFKVMNSWGTGWGDAGYSWIGYSFLPQAAGQWSFAMSL